MHASPATFTFTFSLAAAVALALPLAAVMTPLGVRAAPPPDRGSLRKRKRINRKASLVAERPVARKRKTAAQAKTNRVKKGAFHLRKSRSDGLDAAAWRLLARKAKIRRAMILQLEKLAASRNLPDERKADVIFRLAETWREESHYRYLRERVAYDRALQAYEARLRKGKR